MKTLPLIKRTILVSILFCLSSKSVISQLNHFFPDSNAYFSVSPFKFFFVGDTLINEYRYKKVYYQSGDPIADFNRSVYYASIREDTINEKIYCIQKEDGVERLIYDFSVSVGSTVSVFSFWPFYVYPEEVLLNVSSIDSISINNVYLRKINLSYNNITEWWIEGIGSNFGLFFPGAYGWADLGLPKLLCIHKDDTLYYQFYSTCYLDLDVSIIENELQNFDITPTLASDKLYFKPENILEHVYKYFIYSIFGRILVQECLTSSYIDINMLPKGFYLITVFNPEKGNRYTKKFIKI